MIDQEAERNAKKAEEMEGDTSMDQDLNAGSLVESVMNARWNLAPGVMRIPVYSKANRKPITAQKIDDAKGFYDDHILPDVYSGFAHNLAWLLYSEASQRLQEMVNPIEMLSPANIEIMVYQRTDVTFTSLDSLYEQRSIIQCRPQFFSRTRFDTVLVNTDGNPRPARLHLIFEATAYGRQWQLARISYFTALPRQQVDKVIDMQRYREEETGEFIFLGAIIRSCYMTPAFGNPGEYFLNPFIAGCTDLYLRCMAIQPVWTK